MKAETRNDYIKSFDYWIGKPVLIGVSIYILNEIYLGVLFFININSINNIRLKFQVSRLHT